MKITSNISYNKKLMLPFYVIFMVVYRTYRNLKLLLKKLIQQFLH